MSIVLRKAEKTTSLSDLQDHLQQVEEGGDLLVSLSTKTLPDGTDADVAAFRQGAAVPPLGALELFTEPEGMSGDREAAFFNSVEADGSNFVTSGSVFIEGKLTRVIVCRRPVAPGGVISLSWDNVAARKAWSAALLGRIAQEIGRLEEGDPEEFITGYGALPAPGRLKFGPELIIAVALEESGWDPHNQYLEASGEYSVGLLQLSYSDQDRYELGRLSPVTRDLEDPVINLQCAVTIFATLLARDKVVARSAGGYAGGAAYWSTLREGPHPLEKIRHRTREQAGLG